MSTYERIAELPVEIDSYALEGLSIKPSPEFERVTTVVQVCSDGLTGNGEDITYEGLDAIALQDAGPVHDLTGPRTIGELCELIGGLDLFPSPPEREVSRLYRRWAFESAALDLALKQADTTLSGYLGTRTEAAELRRFDGSAGRRTAARTSARSRPSWTSIPISSSSSTRLSTGMTS